jgi:glutathione synthase/RimK-type ligase-like ATP-grasp enzyme
LRGQRFYNPPHIPGKLTHCCWLRAEAELRDNVPETIRYTGAKSLGLLLSHHPAVVLKRNWGSLGIGILRVRHSAGGFIWEAGTGPRHRCAGLAAVASGMRSRTAGHQYLVQQSLQLARYRGRSFDLRCVVQRDGTGAWSFVGACLRLSGRNRIATNVAQGGRALKPMPILRSVFGEEAVGKYTDLQHFSVQVATALTRHQRGLADLGLDLAFGADGRLWFIEANTRPMRYSLSRSRQWARYRESYRLPMEYGYSLLQQKQTGPAATAVEAEPESGMGSQVGAS